MAHKVQVRILSTIPLIAKKTAEVILQHTTLALILSGSIDAELLANIEKSPKTKIGPKAAQNILEHLFVGSNLATCTATYVESSEQNTVKKPILANRVKKE